MAGHAHSRHHAADIAAGGELTLTAMPGPAAAEIGPVIEPLRKCDERVQRLLNLVHGTLWRLGPKW